MEEYTDQRQDVDDTATELPEEHTDPKLCEENLVISVSNENVDIFKQLDESAVVLNANKIRTEELSKGNSVESEMEKLHDCLSNDVDNLHTNVAGSHTEGKMSEDLQNILGSNESQTLDNTEKTESIAIENADVVVATSLHTTVEPQEVPTNEPEPTEQDEPFEDPINQNLLENSTSEPNTQKDSQSPKNNDDCNENDELRSDTSENKEKNLSLNEENVILEKENISPSHTPLTQETELVNIPCSGENSCKNVEVETVFENTEDVIGSNPLGETENLSESVIEFGEKESNNTKNMNKSHTEPIDTSMPETTTDFLSTGSKEDDSNKSVADAGSVLSEVTLDSLPSENQEGADAELCIIPDTEREISQVCLEFKYFYFYLFF